MRDVFNSNNNGENSNIDDTQNFNIPLNQANQNFQGNPNMPPQSVYQNYNPYQPPKSSNTGLIAIISVLGSIIVIGIVVLTLFLTGVINFSGQGNQQNTVAVVATPNPVLEPSAVPAPQVDNQPQNAAPAQNFIPSQNTTVVSYKYVSNVKNSIYLRSEPAENDSNIITEIPLGTSVGFIENTDGTFAKVNYNGTIGYSKQMYLSDSTPYVGSANTSVSYYVYVANVKTSIYFRSAPAENDSNIITEIPLGTQVGYIESVDGTFSKISYNGQIGYAKTSYLSSTKPSTSSSSSSSSSSSGGSTMKVVNVASAIYLRSSPSESSNGNIVTEIPVGSTVTYLGTANSTFYKISYGGTVGYAKQMYLSFN